jgi:signal transduction histidine kinase/CheY-like chemotaxis protein
VPAGLRSRSIPLGLVLLAAMCLGLHVREVARTGLWQSPVYALSGARAQAWPVVGGETPEVQGAPHALRVGDVLLRIGERDLRGHGHLGFLGRAYEEADASGAVALEIERDGRHLRTELRLAPLPVPWMRIPFLGLMLALVAYLTWRLPADRVATRTAVTLAAAIVGESVFEGGGLAQVTIAKAIFIFGGLVWCPLLVRLTAYDPARGNERPMPFLRLGMALAGAAWVLPKLQYLLGGPAPPALIPATVAAGEALVVTIPFGFFVANYRRADEAKRRSLRWIFHATLVSAVLMIGALSLLAVEPRSTSYSLAIGAAGIAASLIPIGFLISMTAYDLFDIDRLISATASYSFLLVGFLAVLLAGVPALAGWLAPILPFDRETGRLVLSVSVALLAVPAAQWLRPRVENVFFPEGRRVESGIETLLAEQALETTAAGVAERVARRVFEIFQTRFCVVFECRGDRFVPLGPGLGKAPRFGAIDAGHPGLEGLSRGSRPMVLDERQRAGRGGPPRAPAPAFLLEAEAALLLPVREAGELAALVAVGRKRSDDVYTGGELTMLAGCLEAASRHLDRVREGEALAEERDRAAALDRERLRMEAAHLARSRHLAAASHDLRQPLHALRLSAEVLGERLREPEDRAIAERMRASAGSLHEMFDSLIDLARLDQGTLPVAARAFALDPLLERLAAETAPLAAAKQLALSVAGCGAWVQSDPVLLGRVLQNLLVNAIRYTVTGSVALRAERRADGVRIEVADTGPGIPADMREAVFDEFVRLAPAGAEPGLGLGLSIVRRLSERLGHPLRLESRPTGGTCFSLVLPAAQALAAAPSPLAPDAVRFEGGRVLVADDDLAVLASMRALLESWGLEVALATGVAEAVDSWRSAAGGFDALISDYRLGGSELGTALIDAVRAAAGRPVPALVITGAADPGALDDIATRGLVSLPKPVSPARLRTSLAAALREARAARATPQGRTT